MVPIKMVVESKDNGMLELVFNYYTDKDSPHGVAQEMVKEIQLSEGQIAFIQEAIEQELEKKGIPYGPRNKNRSEGNSLDESDSTNRDEDRFPSQLDSIIDSIQGLDPFLSAKDRMKDFDKCHKLADLQKSFALKLVSLAKQFETRKKMLMKLEKKSKEKVKKQH
eukprot:TRINITY_DN2312_c0_g1_i1.p3 TRINITY_DN2312_c0_g1~~TRINITY_DN2312_c0_g1_i1.p3  ORF type:complete len:165 (-),score=33.25 TRINITY_DN2312_c0_g1_i1:47-541(-)